MAFPMWWLLIFLAASLALCFVWNWWRSLALKSSVWTMMPILSLTVTCENPPCPSLRTFRPSFSPLRCLPEPCSSLECCNNYTETVSPFTFWLLSFANSQFLVITKSVPLAGRLKAEFSSGEGGRTVMIGWASQQGKSVCPDRLLSREPPCFHGTVTYLTIISVSPPYFPGGATPASSPDSHLGPLCLLFSSKKLFLPLTENPSLVLPSFPVCPGSSVFLPALSSCTSALGLICIFWTLLHLLLFFHGQLLEFTYSFESESESEVTQSCLTLGDPVDCSPPGSSVHGILQARVLEWVAVAFSAEPLLGGHNNQRLSAMWFIQHMKPILPMIVHMHVGTKFLVSSWWKNNICQQGLSYTILSQMACLMDIWHSCLQMLSLAGLVTRIWVKFLILAQCNHVSMCPFVPCTSGIPYSTDGAGCEAGN